MRPAVARGLHPRPDEREVDHAVAHHAAIEQQVGGRHQPVAEVKRHQASGVPARALDLALEIRVPPDVIDVDRDAEAGVGAR